jgi:hypothetical protein
MVLQFNLAPNFQFFVNLLFKVKLKCITKQFKIFNDYFIHQSSKIHHLRKLPGFAAIMFR